MRRAGIACALLVLGALAPGLLYAGPYDRLIRVIEKDEAYKVRMKAIRVVAKRVKKSGQPAPGAVVDALSRAATKDESYLVRGMACFAFGQLADARGRPALEAAMRDGEAFVREQAKTALNEIAPAPTPTPAPTPAPAPAPAGGGRDLLVFAAELTPGGPGEELSAALLGFLQDELTNKAPDRRIGRSGDEPGHLLTGTVARLDTRPADSGKVRLTAEVKLTVATWPERNLRHVMSAKASATVAPNRDNLRLRKKLVRAALAKAVSDALAALGGGD